MNLSDKTKFTIVGPDGKPKTVYFTKKEAYHHLIDQLKATGDILIDSGSVKDLHPVQILDAVIMSYYKATQEVNGMQGHSQEASKKQEEKKPTYH